MNLTFLLFTFNSLAVISAAVVSQAEMLDATEMNEGSKISSGKTVGSIGEFLTEIERPSMRGNLRETRASASTAEFQVQQEVLPEHNTNDNRNLQEGATVTLVNNCGFDAHLAIYYISGNWIYGRGFYYVKADAGTFTIAHQVTSSQIHLYGIDADTGHSVWDSPSSEYCFARNDCFKPMDIGPLNDTMTVNLCPDPPVQVSAPVAVAATEAPVEEGITSAFSPLANEWVVEHNRRRKSFYEKHGLSDMPLKWSDSVSESAKAYADSLLELNACDIQHGYKNDHFGGENLAANWGTGDSRTTDQILTAWFDKQIDLPNWLTKLHATQVVFRSSLYFGCGESEKVLADGRKCYIQACRYVRAGNCFPSGGGNDNWIIDVLSDAASTRCGGPACPVEGCF